jgi:hypothetical protein
MEGVRWRLRLGVMVQHGLRHRSERVLLLCFRAEAVAERLSLDHM